MKVIAVDDEALLLEDFVGVLETIDEIKQIKSFTKEQAAIDYVKENRIDVAMLDVQMPAMGGIILAEKLSEIQPDINVIFVTGYAEYGLEAMKLHASGYLIKTPTKDEIIEELHKLRYPIKKEREPKRIRVHTFGNFDVYVDGKPVSFSRQRAKELLAYLVHRKGETVTRKQIAGILFEDMEYDRNMQHRLQNVLVELKKTLVEYKVEGLVLQGNNSFSINRDMVDCDMYDFFDNDWQMRKKFHGYYMENYSWAEEMTGRMNDIVNQ